MNEPGYIPARTRHAVAQTGRDRIDRDRKDDGDVVRRRDQDLGGRRAGADQTSGFAATSSRASAGSRLRSPSAAHSS